MVRHTDSATTIEPDDYAPDRFTHDETIDLGKKVNHIYTAENGDVFRVSVGTSPVLFWASFYAKNDAEGVSRASTCHDETDVGASLDRSLSVF